MVEHHFRKAFEKWRKESEKLKLKQLAVLDAGPEALAIVDTESPEWQILHLNKSAMQLLGARFGPCPVPHVFSDGRLAKPHLKNGRRVQEKHWASLYWHMIPAPSASPHSSDVCAPVRGYPAERMDRKLYGRANARTPARTARALV